MRNHTVKYCRLFNPIRLLGGHHDDNHSRSVFNRTERLAKLRGKKVSRFWTESFRPGAESFRQVLPPLSAIRPSSGLHDNKYSRSVFNGAERLAKLRGSMISRFYPESLPCNVFWAAGCGPTQTPSHNRLFTDSICRTKENCGDVQ